MAEVVRVRAAGGEGEKLSMAIYSLLVLPSNV